MHQSFASLAEGQLFLFEGDMYTKYSEVFAHPVALVAHHGALYLHKEDLRSKAVAFNAHWKVTLPVCK